MSGIHRFLSKRDKNGDGASKRQSLHFPISNTARNASVESVNPDSVADFYGLFSDTATPNSVEETKIKTLRRKIASTKSVLVKNENILWCLRCNFGKADVDSAYDLLSAMTDASEGIVLPYDPNIKMHGAINRQGVTCFLDSTLFAMFSRLDSFEAMLYNNFEDRSRNRLAFLLRLWVNLLRAGKLITTDVTRIIQATLADCGWEDAAELHQQDASEAFTFITEKLQLPLLTLKMDMFHAGKQDADDHKFINERLLEVAIPEGENGEHKDTKLEDCLEDYFNNRIEVRRFLERRSTVNSMRSSDTLLKDASLKNGAIHVETVEIDEIDSPITPLTPISPLPSHMSSTRPVNRSRAPSIIQERFIPEKDESTRPTINGNLDDKVGRLRKGSVRKEVLMPAWQFFSLIPWYTNNTPANDAQVAAHFSSKRPILGLCLKRYSMLPNGTAIRLNTFIDVPVEIGLPHFIQDDHMTDDSPLYGNFKLSLQSVVCHRGNSVDSGHYISLVRATAKDPGAEVTQWMRFDDMAPERITMIDINKALKEETPYLLFYQIVPVDGDPGNLTAGEKPPSYSESQAHDSGVSLTSGSPERVRPAIDSPPVSNRPSLELPVPEDRGRATTEETRRPSVISFTEHLRPPRSESQDGTRRKSMSLGRSLSKKLSSMAGGSKNNDNGSLSSNSDPEISVVEEDEPAVVKPARINVVQPPVEATAAIDIPGSKTHGHHRRDKSKNRLSKVHGSKVRGGNPDRECNVM